MSKLSKQDQEKIEKLVEKVKKRDHDAFAELYEIFVQRIYRYIYYRIPRQEVEDILEMTFLKVWENIDKYKKNKSGSQFSAWVFRIAHNLVVDFYRGRKESTLELDMDIPDDENRRHSPLRFTQNQLNNAYIEEALEKINENHREIIVLKFINDLSNKEIGEILDKSEGALRILQFRALKALKKVLTGMGVEP